jgi:hypothetical protein
MKTQIASLYHFIVAFILITKGFDKIQNHHSLIGWSILSLGMVVLIFFVYSKISKNKHSWLDIIIHLFESIALFLTSYTYFQEGKSLLPYITLLAAIGFLVATIIHLQKTKK